MVGNLLSLYVTTCEIPFLGYTPYDLGIKDDELARIRKQVKEDKKKSGKKIGDGKSFRVSPVRVKPKRVN
mgnify:CR=1 FL=1